ncbi:hypothetical protein Rcae01_01177 [Novipirellula caenicola]|uniref:Uncharacterized protein n=1 Tax=Novipirellula caenicola TaxID=1536901 RepID=A0ABP9VN74_9BACT
MVRPDIFQFTIVNLTFSISSTDVTRPAQRGGSENEPQRVFRGGHRGSEWYPAAHASRLN